jgi:3-phenylpropionate/cinnamic acid dioxygenase small subunit
MAGQINLESLHKRLRLLEDKDELNTLLNRYCNTADDHKWDEFAACFIPDGVLGFEKWGDIVGRDKIAAAAGGAENRFQGLQHSMTNMQFTINEDTASARCYLWFAATMDTSKPHEYHAFGGHYRFQFKRTSEGWRIARMELHKVWAQNKDTEGVFGA